MTKRTALIKKVGFKKDVTKEFKKYLKGQTTKTARTIEDRINNSEYYNVYISDNEVTVYARYQITQQEQTALKKAFKRNYKKVGTAMDENGLWLEWVRA